MSADQKTVMVLSIAMEELIRRLRRIAQIIEDVDNRCLAADGPVTPTLQEMTVDEMREIYGLAKLVGSAESASAHE